MAYVVTAPCLDCTFTDCADVCPVQAFHQGPDFLYINPKTCIDCDACVSECPVNAIFPEADVPEKWKSYITKNSGECEKFPVIAEKLNLPRGPRCIKPDAS